METLKKIGALVGAVVLQQILERSGAIAPKSLKLNGMADDYSSLYDGGGGSPDLSYDVPSDVAIPYVPSTNPYYNYGSYGSPYGSYPQPYNPNPSYNPFPYQNPSFTYQPPYQSFPNQQYGLPPQGSYSGYPYQIQPGYYQPTMPASPISSLISSLFPTTGAGASLTGQEAANDSAVQFGIQQGLLQQTTACFGQVPGLSQYHNCRFTIQTSRGSKSVSFVQAAAAMKRYQRTGKI